VVSTALSHPVRCCHCCCCCPLFPPTPTPPQLCGCWALARCCLCGGAGRCCGPSSPPPAPLTTWLLPQHSVRCCCPPCPHPPCSSVAVGPWPAAVCVVVLGGAAATQLAQAPRGEGTHAVCHQPAFTFPGGQLSQQPWQRHVQLWGAAGAEGLCAAKGEGAHAVCDLPAFKVPGGQLSQQHLQQHVQLWELTVQRGFVQPRVKGPMQFVINLPSRSLEDS
jgi:hypothetical protein